MWRRYMVWIDSSGLARLTLVNTIAGGAGIETNILANSNADILSSVDNQLIVNATPVPVNAQFPNISDSALLSFAAASGELMTLQLVAPKQSIFLADLETVDPTQITGLISSVIGTATTASGSLITAYVSGVRVRTRRELYTS